MRKKPQVFYICYTNWLYEMGQGSMRLFKSKAALKRDSKCWKECGIARLEIRAKRVRA